MRACRPVLTDFRGLPDGPAIEADICIVGAGAAGIAVAVSLIGSRHHVCLVESGGLESAPETQALYRGETAGLPWGTELATSRSRFFGGTTNQWPGGCIPLARMDFEQREWVPFSGWPMSRADLDPWYDRARSVLRLPAKPIGEEKPADRDKPRIAFDPDKLVHRKILMSRQPRLGARYRAMLARAGNVRVLLNANLVELDAAPSAAAIMGARVATLCGKLGYVRARKFVLACGGIENPRLLLLSNSVVPHGLGNQHDLVGRFFMDHPSATLGTVCAKDPAYLGDPYNRMMDHLRRLPHPGEISLSPAIQMNRSLLNARVRPQDYEVEDAIPDGIRALRQLRTALRERSFRGELPSLLGRTAKGLGDIVPGAYRRLRGNRVVPDHRMDLEGFFEQAPNPDSRITLADTRDALGQNRVRLDWRLTELDLRTYRAAGEIFAAELARLGLGQVELHPWLLSGDGSAPPVRGMAHHLGTTRMSDDPRTGVVDRNCRVHGIENLYVAGGSVFPAGGWALPTFTIVALALRLADHLSRG